MLGPYALALKIGALVLTLALAALWLHSRDESFRRQGAASVQHLWDAERVKIAAASLAQAQARDRIEAQGRARNQEIVNDLANKLDAVAADRQRIYERLRALSASANNHPGGVPAPATGSGDLPQGGPESDGRLDALLGAAIAECRANAIRQDAMMNSLEAQLSR